ncbi:hypothetical protein BASA60_000836 [Batrachochytrium salamandrivorans]|nr:hypothetical protein BASA60_000836 [Batrachochytrium salamandrivorans]
MILLPIYYKTDTLRLVQSQHSSQITPTAELSTVSAAADSSCFMVTYNFNFSISVLILHRNSVWTSTSNSESRLRRLGRALDPGVENVYTWLRGGVLNGETDLDQVGWTGLWSMNLWGRGMIIGAGSTVS